MVKKRINGTIVHVNDGSITIEIGEDDCVNTEIVIGGKVILEGEFIENPDM